MNINLIIQHLTVAIISTVFSVAFVLRFKGFCKSDIQVEILSIIVAFLIGVGVATYYAGLDIIAACVVGFFNVLGAEGLYQQLKGKIKTFGELKADGEFLIDMGSDVFEYEYEEDEESVG